MYVTEGSDFELRKSCSALTYDLFNHKWKGIRKGQCQLNKKNFKTQFLSMFQFKSTQATHSALSAISSGLVWILNGQKEAGLQMVRILNGIWNWKPNHFIKNYWKSWLNCLYFERSGFQMVGTIAIAIAKPDHLKTRPFEIWPAKSLDFEWSDFRSPLYWALRILSSPLMLLLRFQVGRGSNGQQWARYWWAERRCHQHCLCGCLRRADRAGRLLRLERCHRGYDTSSCQGSCHTGKG